LHGRRFPDVNDTSIPHGIGLMTSRVHEKRKRRRARSRQAAWIKLSDSAKPIPCVLWDQSEKGARIAAGHSGKMPDVFALFKNKEAPPRLCRVKWRKGSMVGVRFIEPGEVDRSAAPARNMQEAEAPRPNLSSIKLPPMALYPEIQDGAPPGSSVSKAAGGFMFLLLGLTVMFYFAGREIGTGTAWADQVCQKANNMCLHPEFSGGAAILMALIYFVTRGMEF
jgi:hypothetical protein